ncbi:MAG: hypothetical protein ACHQ49_17965 [Elusimicrobiota bacterium]
MKRLLLDCSVVALVAWGAYSWTHRPVPRRAPAISGAMPNLDMPPARAMTADLETSMLVVPEEAGRPEVHVRGALRREKTLGEKPQVLGGSAVDITAGGIPDALPDEKSPWSDRLRQPWAFGAIVALFIVLYALMTRALRKGPGGHGFSHD